MLIRLRHGLVLTHTVLSFSLLACDSSKPDNREEDAGAPDASAAHDAELPSDGSAALDARAHEDAGHGPDAGELDANEVHDASADSDAGDLQDAEAHADGSASDAGHADAALTDGAIANDSDASVSFAALQAIFDEHCVLCHDASKQGLPSYPALPLTTGASHDALVGKSAHESCGGTLVVPGKPEQSYLYHKLTDTTPCEGEHMPRPFERGPMLSLDSSELATVRAWIEAGAPR